MAGPDRAPIVPTRAAGRKDRGPAPEAARRPTSDVLDGRRRQGLERAGATGHPPDVQAERGVTVPPRAVKG